LENTTLSDLVAGTAPRSTKGKRAHRKKEKDKDSAPPMVVGGQKSE